MRDFPELVMAHPSGVDTRPARPCPDLEAEVDRLVVRAVREALAVRLRSAFRH